MKYQHYNNRNRKDRSTQQAQSITTDVCLCVCVQPNCGVNFIRTGCSRVVEVQAVASRRPPVSARPSSEMLEHQRQMLTTAADQWELDDFALPPLHEQQKD